MLTVAPPLAAPPPWLALGWLVLLSLAVGLGLVLWPHAGADWAWALAALVVVPAAGLLLVQRAGASGGLPLALLMALVVLLTDTRVRSGDDAGLDLYSAAKFSVWALGLLLAAWRWPALLAALRHPPTALLALLGLWCLLGSLWSATPAYTVGASVAWLGLWALAAVVAAALPLRQALLALGVALSLLMAASLLLWVWAPGLALTPMDNGRHLRLSGAFASPNNLGRAAALLVLVAALAVPLWRRGPALVGFGVATGLGLSCLVLSGSRGSVLALLAAGAVALLGRRPLLLLYSALLMVAAALLAVAAPDWMEALTRLVSRSGRVEELSSVTGRTEIWAATARLIEQAPLLGHGFASSREVLPAAFQGAYGWTTTSAHNLWLQAWLTTGAVGLAVVLAAQAAWLRQAWRQALPARDALVVFVLVVGLVEASALGPSVNLMSFVWLWAMALGLRVRHV